MIIPIRGHPNRTTTTPPRKHELPFSLCFWKKNLNVLSRPMTSASPDINNICKRKGKTWKADYHINVQSINQSINQSLFYHSARQLHTYNIQKYCNYTCTMPIALSWEWNGSRCSSTGTTGPHRDWGNPELVRSCVFTANRETNKKAYIGHVLNLPQTSRVFWITLPANVADLLILIIRKQGAGN